jgi:hypothetical protein
MGRYQSGEHDLDGFDSFDGLDGFDGFLATPFSGHADAFM